MGTRAKKNLNNQKSAPGSEKKTRAVPPKSAKALSGSYRIIAGDWRSRRLNFPAIDGLRPTTDRVRETLFNWLANEIQGARVLDLFAGSGALGIEALSRGASSLCAIEKDKSAWRALRENIELLLPDPSGRTSINILCADALAYLANSKAQNSDSDAGEAMTYDLVFMDPPFRQGLLELTLKLMEQHPLLAKSALIYVEQEKETTQAMPKSWRLLKEKVAGQVRYQLYRHEAP